MDNRDGTVTLGATGDILLHKRIYDRAQLDDGTFDFSPMFENIKPLFKKDHLIIVNQESIIAGKELGLSDFPRFNSPVEICYTLKDMNVDIVNIANNHTLDRGEKGVLMSIDNWEKIGLPYVGAYKSQKDQETLRIINKNGMRFCFLSYTDVTLGKKPPKNKRYLLNIYKNPIYRGFRGFAGLRRLIHQIKRNDLADVIVLSIHYGQEYHQLPSARQKEISTSLANAGVDIIIGHHPHVLQPPEYITDSRGREVFVAYSLGNFFSGQRGIYRQIGAYMTVDIDSPNEESGFMRKIHNPTMTLTYVDSTEKQDYKMYLLKDIVESQETIQTDVGVFKAKEIYNRMIKHLTKWIPDMEVT